MKKFYLSLAIILICSLSYSQTSIPGGNVSGTWTLADSPYQIQGSIMIPNDSTLIIQPGVTVQFQGMFKLLVLGRLLSIGTVADTISFTAIDTTNGWRGIRFDNTTSNNDTSKLQYCKLQYGKATGAAPDDDGGAFYFNNFSKTIISNCRISNCSANDEGGGFYFSVGSPVIINNTISNNTANSYGGGIAIWNNSNPTITNNTISNNVSQYGGGIVSLGSPIISNNTISNNTASGFGGGIYCTNSPTIFNNTISNNMTSSNGGGIYCANGSPNISNNTISNNTASSNGGAIFCSNCVPTITNNVITNSNAANGGGLYCMDNSDPTVRNTIFWGNTASISGTQVFLFDEPSDPNFYYCDVSGGSATIDANGNFFTGAYSNNINSDPLFVAPSGGSGTGFNGETADWSLQAASPCINIGDPNGTYPATDKAGNPRVSNCRIDIGAFEYQSSSTLSVNGSTTNVTCNGANNGTATATPTGGNTPYTYSWSNSQTTATITGLVAGIYSVTVTDSSSCTASDSVTVAVNTPGSWTQKANFGGSSRYDAVGFSIGTKGYLGTGTDPDSSRSDFWEWDQTNNLWTQKANFAGTARYIAVSFSIGNKGYLGTGYGPGFNQDFWEYNPGTNVWAQKANFGGGIRSGAVGFSIGNKGYIGTGNDNDSTRTDFWEYDPITDVWTEKASFGGIARTYATGFSVDSKGYIGTGQDGLGNFLNDIWEWDQGNNTWAQKANFPGTARKASTSFSIGNKIFLGTGTDTIGSKYDFWEFNPLNNIWSQKANLISGKSNVVGFAISEKGYIGTGFGLGQIFFEFDPTGGLLATNITTTDVTCNGGSDGTATATPSGGFSPYTYLWSNSQTIATITGLASGIYSVTLTDSNGCTASDSVTVSVNTLGFWTQKANFGGTERRGAVGFSIGTKGYVGTGYNDSFKKDFWEYDQSNNTWAQKADFGGTARQCAVGFSIGTKGYIGTGKDSLGVKKSDFWEYDPIGNTWNQKADYGGVARYGATGFSIGTKGYIGTGYDDGGAYFKDFWEWDQTNNIWIQRTDFGGAVRHYSTGFSIGLKGYIGLGWGSGGYVEDFWEWNQSTDTWTQKANFGGGLRDVAVGFSIGSKGYIGTGNDNIGHNDFWEWDQAGNTWIQKATFIGTPRQWAVGFAIGTKGYLGTGFDTLSNYKNDFYEFDPTGGLLATNITTTDVTCNGGSDGTATAIPTGGFSPYTYLWSNSQTTATITGLTAGNYSVTVTDNNGCTSTAISTISQPALIQDTIYTSITPCDSLFAGGGWQTSTGIYFDTLASFNGCDSINSTNLTVLPELLSSYTDTITLCFPDSILLSATAGYDSYNWNTGDTSQSIYATQSGDYAVSGNIENLVTNNYSLQFDNNNDYVSILNNLGSTTNLTLCAWINFPQGIDNFNAGYNILGSWPQTNSAFILRYDTYLGNHTIAINFETVASGNKFISFPVTSSDFNNWIHVAFTYDGDTFRLFKNGILKAELTGSDGPLKSGSSIMTIGCQENGGFAGSFNGKIDEVEIWNIELDSTQIQNYLNCHPLGTESGLVGYWNFEEGTGTTTADQTSNGNNGTLVNGTTWSTIVPIQSCSVQSCSDSVYVNVLIPKTNTVSQSICNGDSILLGGLYRKIAGFYIDTLIAENTCDSIVTTNLSIKQPTTSTQSASACVSYNWNGTTYTTSGAKNFSTTNAAGCDSTATLNLTILEPTTSSQSVSACVSYDWNGTTYTTSGAKTFSTTNAAGCDSTATLNLTILQPTTNSQSTNICNGDSILLGGSFQTTGGTYYDTLSSVNGCDSIIVATLTLNPSPTVTVSSTNATCNGCSDGTATANVIGGTSPYTYSWSNGATTFSVSGLPASVYFLTVTDANGCTATGTITITQPTCNLTLTISSTNVSCYGGDNGSATAIPSGGTSPFTYQWGNGATTSANINLQSTIYYVTVTDVNGCSATANVTITQPAALSVNATVSPATCGVSNGSGLASATGGTSPYSYQWSSGDTTSFVDSLASGVYMVTATDANSCSNFSPAIINNTGAPIISVSSITNVNCYGGNDGAINISVNGGSTPYTYSWSNGATTQDIGNLAMSPYEIIVTGANGCTSAQSIFVSQPAVLSATVTVTSASCGGNDGSATVTPSGGSSPYTYLWSNGPTTSQISNLTSQIYYVTVTDNNGCVKTASAAIGETGGATVIVDSIISAGCGGGGSIYVILTGGTSPYTYSWTDSSTTQNLINAAAGNYGLIVTDSNGCTGAVSASIPFQQIMFDPICLITVDTVTETNKLVWKKTNGMGISYYKIGIGT